MNKPTIPPFVALNVSIGYTGIELFGPNEIDENQVGYSVSGDGKSLIGTSEGDWRKEWIVIGRELCCGDPIFIDASEPELPVYTAMHGEGDWMPNLISSSYNGLLKIIEQLRKVAAGREDPDSMEAHPMTQKEYDAFLAKTAKLGGLDDCFFWALMVSDEEAGIGP